MVSKLERTRIKLGNYWLLTPGSVRRAPDWSTRPELAADWSDTERGTAGPGRAQRARTRGSG